MERLWVLLAVLLTLVGLWWAWALWQRHRRRRIAAAPFPAEWEAALQRWVMYRRLPDEVRCRLQRRIQVFLAEKKVIACGGLELEPDMPVLLAAHACLLVVNRAERPYPGLHTILLYPSGYLASQEDMDEAGVVTLGQEPRLGESWEGGHVVLGWEQIEEDLAEPDDGHNVVFHEFAHQLDHSDGAADGVPPLTSVSAHRDWSELFQREFEALRISVASGRRSVLDPYAATDPAEFFAVLTETFFEQPHDLAEQHPQLHRVLVEYFRLDPRDWQPRLQVVAGSLG